MKMAGGPRRWSADGWRRYYPPGWAGPDPDPDMNLNLGEKNHKYP